MSRIQLYMYFCILLSSCHSADQEIDATNDLNRYSMRGWNILSSHRENGLRTLDTAAAYGVNYIELSHYQLCHYLKDLRKKENRQTVNFFTEEAHRRGIEAVYLWDHAFYEMAYYPDDFKVKTADSEDQGARQEKLNLDDPAFWQWVYEDYDSLLALAPSIDGITLTFIETGSYVVHQHSAKLKTGGEKIAALVDSLANYFIDRKGLQLTIRTFIYNQFEKQEIIDALKLIQRKDIRVMIKMVPHDWFLTYPYQDFIDEVPFPVIIEYDGGMEYSGENIVANSFVAYFTEAFLHYHQFDNVVGYCVRTDRFEETAATGTPGEANLYALSALARDQSLNWEQITVDFITKNYGQASVPLLKPAFDSAFSVVMAAMYTLGLHTANHSRLNFHRNTIYHTHTTGEWHATDDQQIYIAHGVGKSFHNYKDVLNALAFPTYKTDVTGLSRDIPWVVDSAWLEPGEAISWEFLTDILTEKEYAVNLAERNLDLASKAIPLISDSLNASVLFHTFNRTVLFAKERKAVAQAVYGYRLWSKGEEYRTSKLQQLIWQGLNQADSLITTMEQYPVPTPLGQWRWHRDREAFDVYYEAITKTGWQAFGLDGVVVPSMERD